MSLQVLFNWQRLGLGFDVAWLWGSQCECGKGHIAFLIQLGPFRIEGSS